MSTPNMFARLASLKNKGVIFDTILDIGANRGDWTAECRTIFPNAKYHLFEANNLEVLTGRYQSTPNVSVYLEVILNDKVEQVEWHQNLSTGDSMFKELTHHYANKQPVYRQTQRLDTFTDALADHVKSVLIKIDCQGAEIPILKGGGKILEKTDFVLLEVPFFGQYNQGVPSFSEHISYMESIGFIVYDILGIQYIKEFTTQCDFLFVRKGHFLSKCVQDCLMTN